MNFDRLRYVAERADLGAQREALFAVEIPEGAGIVPALLRTARQAQRHRVQLPLRGLEDGADIRRPGAHPGQGGARRAAAQIAAAGFAVHDMTDNEMAKLHVRYMVGGQARGLSDERLYRFEFPERPGALLKFLQAIGPEWNISLFHYRNHGSDYGRVLAGIQVPPETLTDFLLHLNELQYAYIGRDRESGLQDFLGPLRLRGGSGEPAAHSRRSRSAALPDADALQPICARRTLGSSAPRRLSRIGTAAASSSAASRGARDARQGVGVNGMGLGSGRVRCRRNRAPDRERLLAQRQVPPRALPRSTSSRARCISAAARYG